MIKVTNVSKSFEKEAVVNQLSMHVKKGSIYGLLGSNGAGKTTLMKMLAGLYKPDSGSVVIDSQEVFENVPLKERVIFLPDTLYFFHQATIEQMATFYRRTYPRWNEKRYQQLKQVFDIDTSRKIHRLSKGMQRQVAFWLVFSSMPDILILDEPIDGLDAVMRGKIKNILVQEVAERNMTVLISSHNLREVEDLCDHVGIMHRGQLLIERDLDDLKSDVHKIQVAISEEKEEGFLSELTVLHKERRGSILISIVKGEPSKVEKYVKTWNSPVFDILPLTLEEIFVYEMGDHGYAIENILIQ
ncbi:ABC transporter ATP-binding protein [Mangrovibacillus cuniculi]|uniref:ABC transporter ATP-binding protein n=1 Tax=Mangrovibacillus cuniculi TaxID=2593652 RepID=A0A7S8HFK7_9BACI|nr:ABC transporter ATP-binding protein [Mangrovibacillus cuniculi]QPC46535.1 ABC transporter ATP-binding protein [Mangrovibacillus cuniculi]